MHWGIDVNASNKNNKYPLIEALIPGHLEAVKLLLDVGANPNSALMCASRKSNREMVESLLNAGGDANMNIHGLTPLLGAVCYCNLEVVELLLDHGADINAKLSGSAHENALSAAMDPERIDIAKLLLKRGADVNVEGTCYGSVLQNAIYRNNIEMVKILVSDKGVDVNVKAGPIGNALDVAYKQKNNKIIKILSNHGAKSTPMLLEESLNEITSNEETSEGFSEEDSSEDESSAVTISDEQSLREDTGDKESLNQEITEEVTLEAEKRDEDTWGDDTMKQVTWEGRASVSEENVQEEEVPNEEIDIASDKTPLMWTYEHHNLDEVRRFLSGHIGDTSQTTLGETALILAIPKIPQILDKEIREILKLLCQITNIVTKML